MCDDDDCCGCGWKGWAIGGVLGIGALLTVVLVPLSLQTVNFDEVAVEYNKVTRNLGTSILTEGLHDVGPAGTLITFKTTQREGLITAITALSSDSIEIVLDIAVFYAIIKDEVFSILAKFGDQPSHDNFITRFSTAVARDVAASFDAKSFYTNRQDFQNQVQRVLQSAILNANVHVTVESVQVLDVTLPPVVLNALEASTVAQQDIENALSERDTQIQAANIALQLAQSQAQITLIEAARDVAVIQQAAAQSVLIERQKMQSRSDAFSNISTGLGLGGEFFVESYLKYLVTQSNNGNTVVGV
jgi:regulator of protease activity HflC (stomatin/prohibitin superfamily)